MQYRWVGPPYPICDIAGWAHCMQYAILPGGPTTYTVICNIAGWAHHTQYAILLGGPTVPNMWYCWMGPLYPMYNIAGWAHRIQCTILLGGPTTYNMQYCWVCPPHMIYHITGWPTMPNMQYCSVGTPFSRLFATLLELVEWIKSQISRVN